MKAPIGMIALALLTSATSATSAVLTPEGVECGDIRCSILEYCSHYDKHCKPCSNICNATSHNYQPTECTTDCQEYLRDQRYVLLERYEDLRGEVGRLWVLLAISSTAALLSLLSSVYLIAKTFPRWKKMRTAVARTFAGKWVKSSNTADNRRNHLHSNNNNNNNNNNNSKVQEDAELGTSKHSGLKLTMPTISASVAPSRESERGIGIVIGNGNESGSASASASGSGTGSGSGSGSRNGSGSGMGHATPNTTTTSLSGRHPSEDTTLDYAYDNPAMTPSPETAQLRTKRESSF